ncbi:transposase, partial [Elizabethkingia argentiflava]|nr:transposase [Elizabethkingia argenteiflava]
INFQYIDPGKPMQNLYIEIFYRTYSENVLVYYIFESLDDVREISDDFVKDYNDERPHVSLE